MEKHQHNFTYIKEEKYFNQESPHTGRGNVELYNVFLCGTCPDAPAIIRVYRRTLEKMIKKEDVPDVPPIDNIIRNTIKVEETSS